MKKLRVLSAIVLTLILCLGAFAPTALAAPYTDGAALTKILAVPVGTDVPSSMSFQFDFAAVSHDGDTTVTGSMPTIASVTLDMTDLATLTSQATNPYTDTGVDYYVLESGNFLAGVMAAGTWTAAGMYEYTITEDATTFTPDATPVSGHTEHMNWSDAEYSLYIYVEETSSGSGSYEIVGVGVMQTTEDDGTSTGSGSGEKIGVVTPGGDATYDYSQVIFNNSYWLTPDGDIENPDPDKASLVVSKTIGGAGVVQADYDRFFDFDLKLTIPSSIPAVDLPTEGFYRAFVVDTDGTIISTLTTDYAAAADVDTATGGDDYIKFVPGIPTDFSLKHGQELVFLDTPVGTEYVVNEDGTLYFQPHYTITTGGVSAMQVPGTTSQSISTYAQHTGAATTVNEAAFLNKTEANPTTGLQSLPMYGLSLLAVVGLTLYVVAKSRKRKDAYSEN